MIGGSHTARDLKRCTGTLAPGCIGKEEIGFRRHISCHHTQLLRTGIVVHDSDCRFIHSVLIILARIQHTAFPRRSRDVSQFESFIDDFKLCCTERITTPCTQVSAGEILRERVGLHGSITARQFGAAVAGARVPVVHLNGVVSGTWRCFRHRTGNCPSGKAGRFKTCVLHEVCIARMCHLYGCLRHRRRIVRIATGFPRLNSVLIGAQIRARTGEFIRNAGDGLRHINGRGSSRQSVIVLSGVCKSRIGSLQVAVGDRLRFEPDAADNQVIYDAPAPCIVLEHPRKILIDVTDQGVVVCSDIVAGHIELKSCARIPDYIVMDQPVARAVIEIDSGLASGGIIVVEPVVTDFRSASVRRNGVKHTQIRTDHSAVRKIVVLDSATFAGLKNNDIAPGVVRRVVANDISVAADVDTRTVAADIIRIVDTAVEQEVFVSAEPHTGGRAIRHLTV